MGAYCRRSCRNAQVFVPVHFYGQLVQQKSGCDILQHQVISLTTSCITWPASTQGHVKLFADIIRQHITSSSNVLNIKATIWALVGCHNYRYIYHYGNQGHIGSSSLGVEMLLDTDIIKEIILMAANNPVFSIRGYHVTYVCSCDLYDHVICLLTKYVLNVLCSKSRNPFTKSLSDGKFP